MSRFALSLLLCVAACSKDSPRAAANGGVGGAGQSAQAGASAAGASSGAGAGGESSGSADGSGQGSAGSAADGGGIDRDAGDTLADSGGSASGFALPPLNAGLDYQLGGDYTPPAGVEIVSRDRNAPIAQGLYNICYVNGFQIQEDEADSWLNDHPDLILRDSAGDPLIDQDWNEMLIDVSTPAKRSAVAAIVGEWIAGCAAKGFDAVEIDNLDSFSRSSGRLHEDDAVAAMGMFSAAAHAAGLAIAQKNSAELVARKSELGTDFVVAEECNRYDECDVYTAAYDDHVLVIEYRRSDFEKGCAGFPGLSIVLRDLDLVTPGSAQYVYDGC